MRFQECTVPCYTKTRPNGGRMVLDAAMLTTLTRYLLEEILEKIDDTSVTHAAVSVRSARAGYVYVDELLETMTDRDYDIIVQLLQSVASDEYVVSWVPSDHNDRFIVVEKRRHP